MFKIVEVEKNLFLKLTDFLDRNEFMEVTMDLRKYRIYYDKKNSAFKVNSETIRLLQSKGFEISNYDFLDSFKEQNQETFDIETDYFRGEVFDETLIKGKLYDYQKEDVNWLVKKSRNFLANEPQTGKTIETIAWISHLRKKEKIKGVLIVVKNILEYHWFREILEHSNMFSENEIGVVSNKNKQDFLEKEIPYVIIIPNHAPVLSTFIEKNEKNISKLKDYCLIIDEVHEFSNHQAKRTQSLESIIDLFQFRIFLSATPAMNDYSKWFTLMRLLDKGIIQHPNIFSFILDIGKVIGDKFNPYRILQYKTDRVEYYNQLFRGWVIKRKKSELPEMRTKQFTKPIWFKLSDKHKMIVELVRKLELQKVDLKTLTYSNIQNNFPYLCMAVDNPEMLKSKIKETDKDTFYKPLKKHLDAWKIEDNNKILYLDEKLKEKIEVENEKVIIYDTHPLTLNQLAERYKKYKPQMIHGELGLTKEKRQESIDTFNNPKNDCKLFLLNVMSASSGLPLYKSGSRTIIFFSLPFDSVLVRQGLDRTYGISSVEDSYVEFLTFDKSTDRLKITKTLNRIEFNDNQFKNDVDLDELLKL